MQKAHFGIFTHFTRFTHFTFFTHFTHCVDTWNGGIRKRYPKTFEKMQNCLKKTGGKFYEPGHHESHAANAFFSSKFDDALIVTIDGGGRDYDKNGNIVKVPKEMLPIKLPDLSLIHI